jgi:hypothetical protein
LETFDPDYAGSSDCVEEDVDPDVSGAGEEIERETNYCGGED